MSENHEVLIVGAGISGLALARALYRRGISALVLEQRESDGDAGLAINLPGNAIAALAQLGLGDAIRSYGRPVERREYRSARDNLLFAVDEKRFWGDENTPRCVRRSDLVALLAADLPAETVRRGVKIVAVEGGMGDIAVHTSDGAEFRCKVLMGADGVHSAVRKLRFESGFPASARLASASWRFMAPNPGVEAWTVWAHADAMALLIPVDHGEVYGWAAATGQHQRSELADLRHVLRSFPDHVRASVDWALSDEARMHYSPLEEVRLSRWSRDGAILIGDAAHATAPVWAQGAALAMEDAIVLSGLLASRSDWSSVGEDYERLRRDRVEHVQTMTDRMAKAARLPMLLRQRLMPFLGPRSYRATFEPLKIPVADPVNA
ncbi:MAG: FAD-binding monooxygenase [Salinicola sp.]|uniref:NAD(P)/FAD-dependent oxidoreductase n=1 Tax=uncultured Salinicola sp. TaxID=1193542 RepID=UPI000C8F0AF8|nr:NAD(P)/FAD-dependent oxidoreductase [uncultured Salinicola sp.]MAM56175.1 FAD-binding monooxygenase [Salinicola sp.]